MARDIRSLPRGLLVPLTQAQLASLRDLSEGRVSTLTEDYRQRLLNLELIEDDSGKVSVTALGRQRLVSDR
jgi:hypothetical protein